MTVEITENSVIVVSRKQLSSDLNNETAILDLDKGIYYGLNEVGTDVWKLVQSPISIDAIRAELLKVYEIDEETLRQDLFMLINKLQTCGLIEVLR